MTFKRLPLVEFKLVREGAIVPMRGSSHAGGLDVFAPVGGDIYPGERGTVPLGIAHQINDMPNAEWLTHGYLVSRSGLARDWGFKLLFDPCLIDHDYRGEIIGVFINHGTRKFSWGMGDRICQIVYHAGIWVGEPGVVTTLRETARGEKGFGSSGR
jgi:dUTP pyrophosphatase